MSIQQEKLKAIADAIREKDGTTDIIIANDFPDRIRAIPTQTIPTGVIVMWSGAANAIPSGWALCNGQNGTPDLRNRFIVGAGSSYGVGATGGADTVTLTKNQMPAHTHRLTTTYGEKDTSGGTIYPYSTRCQGVGISANNEIEYTGGSQPHENRPPYYALCFIMKT